MGIEYSTKPQTLDELCDSVRGQVERSRELAMQGEVIPYEESVELTSESMLALLDRVNELTNIVTHQALMFTQLNDILQWIFQYLGIPIVEEDAEDESE